MENELIFFPPSCKKIANSKKGKMQREAKRLLPRTNTAIGISVVRYSKLVGHGEAAFHVLTQLFRLQPQEPVSPWGPASTLEMCA